MYLPTMMAIRAVVEIPISCAMVLAVSISRSPMSSALLLGGTVVPVGDSSEAGAAVPPSVK